ncbi:hypothetical protein [Streptomyces sp. IBSBF 2435]
MRTSLTIAVGVTRLPGGPLVDLLGIAVCIAVFAVIVIIGKHRARRK